MWNTNKRGRLSITSVPVVRDLGPREKRGKKAAMREEHWNGGGGGGGIRAVNKKSWYFPQSRTLPIVIKVCTYS